jgi:flagellin-like protein
MGHGGLKMKALKKNNLGVSPVIAVILMVAITVVLAGVVFLWAQSFTEDTGDTVDTLSVDMELDATNDILTVTPLKGNIDWADYKIVCNGDEILMTGTTNAGISQDFALNNTITAGEEYNVKFVSLGDQSVVVDTEVTAKA